MLVLAFAGCTASASSRSVVTTKVEFHEAERAAQPSATAAPVTEPPATPVPDPEATPAGSGSDALATSSGPLVFGLLDGEAALEDAWERWNAGRTTTYDQVFEIAVLANRARPLPMSDELMVISLAKAVELSGCEPERLGRVRLLAIAVNGSPHTRELDSELARLSDVGPLECAQLSK